MSLSEIYQNLNKQLSDLSGLENQKSALLMHKGILEILERGKAVDRRGIGSGLDYIGFFDKQGYCTVPKEHIKTTPLGIDGFNIVPLSELMTVPCPSCGSETPYMQRVVLTGDYWASGGAVVPFYPFVIHCGDVREVNHELVEEKSKE